jgi:hypothetical protein
VSRKVRVGSRLYFEQELVKVFKVRVRKELTGKGWKPESFGTEVWNCEVK